MVDWSKFPNFREREFTCPCCGQQHMTHNFLKSLQDMRSDLQSPFIIASGWRCPYYDKLVGGSGTNHPKGGASDIYATRSTLSKIAARAEQYSFTGIGVSLHGDKKFIHLDKTHEHLTVWSY